MDTSKFSAPVPEADYPTIEPEEGIRITVDKKNFVAIRKGHVLSCECTCGKKADLYA